jgi:hypothetical protein
MENSEIIPNDPSDTQKKLKKGKIIKYIHGRQFGFIKL